VSDLQTIFRFSVSALRQLAAAGLEPPLQPEMEALVRRLVTIAETVLTWTFINVNLPKKLISVFEADQNPSLRPSAAWKEVILEPGLVSFFFDLHWRVRACESIAHHSLNCLVQLASLNGQTLNAKDLRLAYLAHYITGFTGLVDSMSTAGAVCGREALGLASIVRKLILFYPASVLVGAPRDLLQRYLEQLVTLSCGFLRAAAGSSEEAELFGEAVEHLLEAWVCILQESALFPPGYCGEAATAIFKTFLETRLAPPDGTRAREAEHEIGETEEADRVRYRDTLGTVGALGRECLDTSLPLLISLLESRTARLHGQMQRLAGQGEREADPLLADLHEDLHWLLLVTGSVLALEVEGETALIPAEVMQHSIKQAASVDLPRSLEVLASPGRPAAEIPGAESSDHVLRLVGAVFRVSEVERRAVEAGLGGLWSPEVSSSLLWLLRRWALTYLATQENYYQEISQALCAAFGRDTEGAAWSVNFLLEKVLSNLGHCGAEPGVVEDTVLLLVGLAESREKGRGLLASPGLQQLVAAAHRARPALPAAAKRGLVKALVLLGAAQEDKAAREVYWGQVLTPLEARYQAVVAREDLKAIYMEAKVRAEVADLLESLTGVVQGATATTVHQLFGWLRPTLASLVHLLDLYHNYSSIVELVLELYCETAKRVLCYLTPGESRALYEASLALVRTYASHQVQCRAVRCGAVRCSAVSVSRWAAAW
jgi:hypothetical protein